MGKVLVADDNSDVRDALGRLLADEGHSVLYSEDGPSTLESIQQQRPDVVLLDIEMPRMGGLEVLEAVRQDPLVMTTPVIIVSVRGRPSDRDRAEALDVTDYILKPWQDGEIEMRVKFALSAAKKTRSMMGLEDGQRSQPGVPSAPDPANPEGYASEQPPGRMQTDREPPPQWHGASTFSTTGGPAAAREAQAPVPSPLAGLPSAAIPAPQVDPGTALILVVEDEEYARLPLVDCMQRAGFRTAEASDGATVAKIVADMKPDVILLDLTLPRLDGLQVLRQLKGSPLTRKSSVIMVTGDTDRSIIEACMSVGARDFVTKPWHGGDMQHRVRRAVKSAQAIAAQAERAMKRVKARRRR